MYPFLQLQQGSNRIRAIGNPYRYQAHADFVVKDNPHYGQRLKCVGNLPASELVFDQRLSLKKDVKEICPLCEDDFWRNQRCLSSVRWILPVIPKLLSQIYLVDMGIDIFRQIRGLATSSDWGDPQKYDLDIRYEYNTYYDGSRKVYTPQVIPIHHSDTEFPPFYKGTLDKASLDALCAPTRADLENINGHWFEQVKEQVFENDSY